jgi:hypothetical protein
MSRPRRLFAPVMLGLAALAASPSSPTDEAENYRQLEAMPRERRIALSENLERFDKLDPAERAAIRKLDAEIARRDPVEQARYRSLLRRYHLWVNGLTEDQKAALKAAQGPDGRFNVARKFRLKELEGATSGPRLYGIRTGDFGLIGPHEAASLLRIWNKLTTARKAEIEKHPERGRLTAEIRAQAKSVGVQLHPFPIADEKLYDPRLEADEGFKKLLGPFARRVDAHPRKAEDARAKGEAVQKKFELRFAEFLYFEEHKPRPVSQKNLERFSATCPGWLHAMLDPLSSDDARAYLTILYRQIYPEPGEMPADSRPAKAATSPTPAPARPGPKRSGPATPF